MPAGRSGRGRSPGPCTSPRRSMPRFSTRSHIGTTSPYRSRRANHVIKARSKTKIKSIGKRNGWLFHREAPHDRHWAGTRRECTRYGGPIWSAGVSRATMIAMTSSDLSGVPEDVAAVRSSIEHEIAGSTLLTEYAETVAQAPDVVAHKWLADGAWHTLTYRQVYDQVRDAALGLAATGLRPGEFAAVWSRNRSEATIADYAVMHARGVPVFIYPTIAAEQAADLIGHCEATVVIVEREFLPVLDSIRGQAPAAPRARGLRRWRRGRGAPGGGRGPGGRERHPHLAGTARPRPRRGGARSGRVRAVLAPGDPGHPRDADLHLGHHGPLQGRHDHPPERPLRAGGVAAG